MIRLQSKSLRADIRPEGGRVTSLVDLRTGRDWIDDWGTCPTEDDVVFDFDTGGGWDECFPTISASVTGPEPWGQSRDHGDVWGRLPTRTEADAVSCEMTWQTGHLLFRRILRLADPSLIAEYCVENVGNQNVPWLWSQHALLRVRPGDRLRLCGLGPLQPAWLSEPDLLESLSPAFHSAGETGIALKTNALVRADKAWAGKFFAAVQGKPEARLESPEGAIMFRWSGRSVAAFLGLWINDGGWPPNGNLTHVALEPTTSPFDSLFDATRKGLAQVLEPRRVVDWRVEIRLESVGLAGVEND